MSKAKLKLRNLLPIATVDQKYLQYNSADWIRSTFTYCMPTGTEVPLILPTGSEVPLFILTGSEVPLLMPTRLVYLYLC